ncbi:hypothetical protein ASF61_06710 [Duganella sp. Leaf126]|uniref:hypothetical protein n=1 Tax=Duganella sp. Leaf126 TaxID=1736266 RepID=UPI0006F54E29|nr:hypothetical protein [Duganella sp. Leaf126]KQQ40439.1 hypothetical protein ASF61_06710 [Duganella sp. Leaf126]
MDAATVVEPYREFEIEIKTTPMQDHSWTAHVTVRYQGKQVGMPKLEGNFASQKEAAKMALLLGRNFAETWRAKKSAEQSTTGTIVLVGTFFYQFPSAEEAKAALRWLFDSNATAEEFDVRFAEFRYMAMSLGNTFTI